MGNVESELRRREQIAKRSQDAADRNTAALERAGDRLGNMEDGIRIINDNTERIAHEIQDQRQYTGRGNHRMTQGNPPELDRRMMSLTNGNESLRGMSRGGGNGIFGDRMSEYRIRPIGGNHTLNPDNERHQMSYHHERINPTTGQYEWTHTTVGWNGSRPPRQNTRIHDLDCGDEECSHTSTAGSARNSERFYSNPQHVIKKY